MCARVREVHNGSLRTGEVRRVSRLPFSAGRGRITEFNDTITCEDGGAFHDLISSSFSCRLLINHRRFSAFYARAHAHARTGPAHPRFSHYTHARERELMPGVSHTCTRTWAPVFHRMKEKSGELPRLPASLFFHQGRTYSPPAAAVIVRLTIDIIRHSCYNYLGRKTRRNAITVAVASRTFGNADLFVLPSR